MNGAQLLIAGLEQAGITHIAGIPGGSNLPVYDALHSSGITHILARHEQGAGFIAQGMARSTGKTAVCLATSGPGAANLVTAIADAKADSVPVLFITGQVPESLDGTDAFQEVDIAGICAGITKRIFRPAHAGDLARMVPEALHTAGSGRPGPVLLDIPKNIQLQDTGAAVAGADRLPVLEPCRLDYAELARAARLIDAAGRPVFYIGGGAVNASAHRILRVFARKAGIPVASSLMGLGAFPADDPLFMGMVGMHGTERANRAVAAADLVIVAGARFNDRTAGSIAGFCPGAAVIHVDIDQREPGRLHRADCALQGDCAFVLRELNRLCRCRQRRAWQSRIRLMGEAPGKIRNEAQRVIKTVAGLVPPGTVITTDVGQHQMWTAQAYPFRRPRTFLTSGGMGTMGFGLPAAIGAALANPDKRIICFTGDGSLMMNVQELATLAENRLNVTVILFDNRSLGMVRQQQEMFYGGRLTAVHLNGNPDFVRLAESFGIPSYRADAARHLRPQLAGALNAEGPSLITVPIPETDNVYPMVRPGQANTDMITGQDAAVTGS